MTTDNNEVENRTREDGWFTMVQAIIHRINHLCNEYDMSIYELSKLSGVNQSTLNEIMQERSKKPRIDTMKKIAFGFGMRLPEFFDDPVFDRIKGVDDQELPERSNRRRKKTKSENETK
ncbi:helix-turn-helix transcriptional regulator [Pallidibacillus pasinlerensis]|uniref:Helix-turn-helix transcriptional regulator n=1 Tax=Pallidibacillus pasinlerensis TaxID=2703818 RepID=A0ABX0A6P0_9BACI|nr:helix-turn-helix transcriptional regulator [Pallidibacillus pasinlerensis]NCU19113.1 helix-turn-helix transcriptional regulator [Pallidibacillus pasinlerensis]